MTGQRWKNGGLVALGLAVLFAAAPSGLWADIAGTGDYLPSYPGGNPDPWSPAGAVLQIGIDAAGQVTVTLGSVITGLDTLAVGVRVTGGADDLGTLTIDSGGQVTAGSVAYIGGASTALSGQSEAVAGGTGRVTVSGPGSSLTLGGIEDDNPLFVGYTGHGTLSVDTGAQVTTSEAVVVGGGTYGTGQVLVDDATLDAGHQIMVGVWGGSAAPDTVDVTIRNGGSATAEQLQVGGLESSDTGFDAETLAALGLANGGGTVNVESDATLALTGPAYIGYSGTGIVNVTTGGQVTSYETALGIGPSSSGTLTVDGAESTYQVADNSAYETDSGAQSGGLVVGGYGTGTATVSHGGAMTVENVVFVGGYRAGELPFAGTIEGQSIAGPANGTGTLTIQDDGSSLATNALAVGATGTGTLNLHGDAEGNATLDTTEAGVGVAADSTGDVVVGNAGVWTNEQSMFVGGYGTGTLTIQSGGHVDAGEVLYIGGYEPEVITSAALDYGDHANGIGTVTVSGAGTALDTPQLQAVGIGVGMEGTGTLQIQNGGRVDSQVGVVGANTDGSGAVTVDGANSLWKLRGDEDVGSIDASGSGTVIVSNGGTIQVDGSNAVLLVGTADDGGQVAVGSTGQGTVTLANGGSVQSGELIIGGTLPSGDLTVQQLQAGGFDSGTGTVEITGAASHWQIGDGDAVVGFAGTGTLNVTDGQVTSRAGWVGVTADGVGIATITGTTETPTAAWTNQETLGVGAWGTGTLNIEGGAQVTASEASIGGVPLSLFETAFDPDINMNGTGTVNVTGAGSTFTVTGSDTLYVGYSGTGALNVLDQGQVDTDAAVIGGGPDAVGRVTVDGESSRMSVTNDTIVGVWGEGHLTVQNEGTLETERLYIGGLTAAQTAGMEPAMLDTFGAPMGTGVVTITGAGSSLTTGELAVGLTGTGTLNLFDDASLTTQEAGIGVTAGSSGQVVVSDAPSSWTNSGSMYVGGYGTGTLTIQPNGHVAVGDALYIGGYEPEMITSAALDAGDHANGTGTVTVTGAGTALDTPQLQALGIGVGLEGTGTLQILNGGRVDSQVGVVGAETGGIGTVTVDGAHSLWQLTGQPSLPEELAANGTGNVTLSNGGAIQVDGANAVLLVGNDITVGSTGQGTMSIANDGYVGSTTAGLGALPGSTGTATIAGSDWYNSHSMFVGGYGTGALEVSGGGLMDIADSLFIGGFNPNHFNIDTEGLGTPAGTGVVTVTGADSTLYGTGLQWLYAGYSGDGTLNIEEGGYLESQMAGVGVLSGSTGHVIVDGAAPGEDGTPSEWANEYSLFVGGYGDGSLTVRNGGAVTVEDALYIGGFYVEDLDLPGAGELGVPTGTGRVNVTGTGSTLTVTGSHTLYVGYSGTGELNVQDQGQVNTESVVIGAGPDVVGTVTVDGDGSQMTVAHEAIVGAWGEGHLSISHQGQVTAESLYLGGLTDSQLEGVDQAIRDQYGAPLGTGFVTVTGSGSTLSVESLTTLVVGTRGTGTLTIADQGVVTASDSIIGDLAGSTGTAGVTGSGSQWQTGDLIVGSLGTGTLNISDSGLVTSNDASVGAAAGSMGTVNVAGTDSQWNVGGDLFVGGTSTEAGGTGLLAVTAGGLVAVTGEMTVWETGTLRGNGTVTVQADDTLHNSGTISPGTSSAIGTLTVNGNVVFEPGSTYAVKIGQTTSDKLAVNGDTTINGGTVQVSSLGTVVGAHDYEILTADSITGTFDVLNTALLTFSVSDPALSYESTAINLHITAANFDDPTIAQTPNQRAVGGGLQEIADTGGSDVTDALQQVDTPENLRHNYDQLSGQTRPPLAPLAATGNSRFLGTVSGRVQSLHSGLASDMSDTSLFAMSGPDSRTGVGRMSESAAGGQSVAVGNGSNILADSKWGLWGRGYGLFGDRETERDAPGYTYHMYGGSLGLDYQFTEKFLGGVVFGVTNGDVDFAGVRDTADLEVYHVGLYGNLTSGQWYLNSMATYGRVQYDTERFVDLTSERLTGDLNGNDWSAYVEAGQNLPLGPQTMLQPLASLQYSYLGLDSYTETGGVSALSYDDQSRQSVKGSLGARLTRQLFESVSGCRGDGQLRARWVHEFGDSQSSVDTSFASNPAAVFTIRDAEIARDSAIVGAGLGVNLTKQLRASADYDALLNADETVQMVSAALQYRW